MKLETAENNRAPMGLFSALTPSGLIGPVRLLAEE